MVTGGPLSDLLEYIRPEIHNACLFSLLLSLPPSLSLSVSCTYWDTPTQRCKHTHQLTHTHVCTHTCTQLLTQAQEETELNLKKQSEPAERTIHHDLCVSELCVCVCVAVAWKGALWRWCKGVTATLEPLTSSPQTHTQAVLTSQHWSLNTHPHSSQGQLDCKWSYISGQDLSESEKEAEPVRERVKWKTEVENE